VAADSHLVLDLNLVVNHGTHNLARVEVTHGARNHAVVVTNPDRQAEAHGARNHAAVNNQVLVEVAHGARNHVLAAINLVRKVEALGARNLAAVNNLDRKVEALGARSLVLAATNPAHKAEMHGLLNLVTAGINRKAQTDGAQAHKSGLAEVIHLIHNLVVVNNLAQDHAKMNQTKIHVVMTFSTAPEISLIHKLATKSSVVTNSINRARLKAQRNYHHRQDDVRVQTARDRTRTEIVSPSRMRKTAAESSLRRNNVLSVLQVEN